MVYKNFNIVLFDKVIFGNLYLENGMISNVEVIKDTINKDYGYIFPGFIDQHIHGSNLFDTMDGDLKSILEISKSITRFGTTSFLPTTMTMDYLSIEKSVNAIINASNENKYANILGINLEGPFISNKMLGAQNENYVKDIDISFLEKINKNNIIKIITVAPEKKNLLKLVDYCKKNNIIVSLGHSSASYDEVKIALGNGATLFTHAYNAMSKFDHRNPNMVGAMLLSGDDIFCELILDMHHVSKEAVDLLFKIKGFNNIILITDAMMAQGANIKKGSLGGQDVFIQDGTARLKSGQLAGSILTQDVALKNFLNIYPNKIVEASKILSYNSAKILKTDDKKGIIKEGMDADLAIFDKDFNIVKTIVRGNVVYGK